MLFSLVDRFSSLGGLSVSADTEAVDLDILKDCLLEALVSGVYECVVT